MQYLDKTDTAEAPLSTADHLLGDANANLTLVEYGDYACPTCQQAAPLVRHLAETEGPRLCFVYRHFPLMEVHPQAELAAEAAEAAAAQGKFWPMHHLLFAQPQGLDPAALAGYAETIGLDMHRFQGAMAGRIYTQRVQEHRRAGERSGVRATPGFFLNDAVIDVSFGFGTLSTAVHAALKGR